MGPHNEEENQMRVRFARKAGAERLLAAMALMLALALLVAGCGGGSESSSTTTGGAETGKSGSTSGGDAALIKEAKAVVERAKDELVYPTVENPTKPSQIVPYGKWRGPTSAPTPPKTVNLQVITCSKQAAGCTQPAEGAVEAAKALGWHAELIDGKGTPEGYADAFNTALSRHPDAIYASALPTVAVGDSLEKAKELGVLTVTSADAEPTSGTKYDAYVPYQTPTMAAIDAWTEIAATEGKANQLVIHDTTFPVFQLSVDNYQRVMEQCAGCSVKLINWQLTDAINPAKVSQILGGALASDPDATGLYVPYGLALPNVSAAVAEAGKSESLTVSSELADPICLQSVAGGESSFTVGMSANWAGWAAVDQVIRGLDKDPYLKASEIGFGVAELTDETAPSDGNNDEWPAMIDYKGEYERIWGLG